MDVVQCESDIDANVHRMHQKLTPADKNEPADPNVLLANIQVRRGRDMKGGGGGGGGVAGGGCRKRENRGSETV